MIKDSITLPDFINDSYKTRKTVTHYVRKTNIHINAKNTNLKTNINTLKLNNGRFKFEEEIISIKDKDVLMDMLGIHKIRRLQTYENIGNHPGDESHRNIIFDLLLDYFIKTDEILDPEYNLENTTILTEFNNTVHNSALKLRKKNNILLKITKELLELNSGIGIYPSTDLTLIGGGFWGKVYKFNDNIYKYEHTRFKKYLIIFTK